MMVASAIAGALSIGGALIAKDGAESAASAESAGIAQQIAFQREVFQQNRADLEPFRVAGVSALQDLSDIFGLGGPGTAPVGGDGFASAAEINRLSAQANEIGGGPRLPSYREFLASRPDLHGPGIEKVNAATRAYFDRFGPEIERRLPDETKARQQNALNKFTTFPGFEFRLEQGQQAQDRSAASRGLLLSGRQVKETERFAQGQASQEFNNFLNGLFNISGIGGQATNTTVQAGQQSANQIGNALANQGASRASGIVGGANALNQGLSGLGQSVGFGLGNRGGFGFPGTTGPIIPNQLSFFG